MIVWLAVVAAASPVDLGLLGGAAVSAEGTERAARTRPAAGLALGVEPRGPGGLPRLEGQLVSAGSSPPDGHAVTVSTWWGDAALLAGVGPALVTPGHARIGVDLLAGPGLRFTRTAHAVYGDVDRATAVGLRLVVGGGPWLGIGRLRVGLRAQAYAPRGHHALLLAGLGFAL